jgi:hypothetical protein
MDFEDVTSKYTHKGKEPAEESEDEEEEGESKDGTDSE